MFIFLRSTSRRPFPRADRAEPRHPDLQVTAGQPGRRQLRPVTPPAHSPFPAQPPRASPRRAAAAAALRRWSGRRPAGPSASCSDQAEPRPTKGEVRLPGDSPRKEDDDLSRPLLPVQLPGARLVPAAGAAPVKCRKGQGP